MQLGNPKNDLDNIQIRIRAIDQAIKQYTFFTGELKKTFQDKIDSHTTFFLKGLGNEINLFTCYKNLYFNSRELLDYLLYKLNIVTKGKTARDFLKFARKLMNGDYDAIDLPIIKFLKNNFEYIFHIRKVRNEIKNSPANIKFQYNTDRFEAVFRVPIKPEEKHFIQYITSMKNMNEAINTNSYTIMHNLDILFPEMLVFWKICLPLLKQ